jgi:hypothetical protein
MREYTDHVNTLDTSPFCRDTRCATAHFRLYFCVLLSSLSWISFLHASHCVTIGSLTHVEWESEYWSDSMGQSPGW